MSEFYEDDEDPKRIIEAFDAARRKGKLRKTKRPVTAREQIRWAFGYIRRHYGYEAGGRLPPDLDHWNPDGAR